MLHIFSAVTPVHFNNEQVLFFFIQHKEATNLTQGSKALVNQYNQATQYLLLDSCIWLMPSKKRRLPFGAQLHNFCFGDTIAKCLWAVLLGPKPGRLRQQFDHHRHNRDGPGCLAAESFTLFIPD